ncbi:MAG: hypothetical protein ACW981_15935 [Candidatus Hodarchaeales archaeon]|jgi:hypothetical protein
MYANKGKKSIKFSKIKFWQRNSRVNVQTESKAQIYHTDKPKFNPRSEYMMYRVKYNR